MPHDASRFASSVKQRKSPEQTRTAILTDVIYAQSEYDSSQEQAARDYRVLTELSPIKPVLDTVTPSSIVKGTGTHSVTLAGSKFKAGMKVQWGSQLLTPTGLTATGCTVTPTKSATATTVDVKAINYDQTIPGASNVKQFTYTATALLSEARSSIRLWTVDEVKQWVGDDHSRAQEALSAEEAREAPRVTLLNWLTALLAT